MKDLMLAPLAGFLVAGIVGMVSASGHAQQPDKPAAAPLFDNLGTYHHAITTTSKDAQRYFDQGLRLVYAFNHDEARRSFEAAVKADPDCAMCYWGIALTLGPNINLPALPDRATAAYEAVLRAQRLAAQGHANAEEKALIDALAKRYQETPPTEPAEQRKLDAAYADAMRIVAGQYPQNQDASVLFAESMMELRPWDLWKNDGTPQLGTDEIVLTLETFLARNPNHPGANHYYIHAVEASPNPEKALPAAERLPGLMPGAGHLVHMPAHIFMRIGRYEAAAQANRRAIIVDQAYIDKTRSEGFYAMYIVHNYQFLSAAAAMEGRSVEAVQAARDTVAHAPPAMLKQMPEFDFILAGPVLTMARFGRWIDVIAEHKPPPESPFPLAMWHYARGLALLGSVRTIEAEAELDAVRVALEATPADSKKGFNSARALLRIAAATLAGRIAAVEGRNDEAIRELEAAVREEDALNYNEPPDWPTPTRHILGAVLLDASRAADAEAVYREDLRRNPENGWSLFGLEAALKARSATDEVIEVARRFHAAWSEADTPLHASAFR